MRDLLARQSLSPRTIADLIAGAIDARLNPQWTPAEGVSTKGEVMTRMIRCAPAGVTVQDQWRSASWMIGGSLTLTGMALLLQLQLGENALSEGLIYSAFPASLMLSSECTYFKRYSPAARIVMSVGGALLIVLMTWGAFALGRVI
jgi:hypothetical protein